MIIQLAYGEGSLPVDFPDARTTVIEPAHDAGLPDERAALTAALDAPISARPLRQWITSGVRVCIVFTDLTRATPNERLIPWLLEYLRASPCGPITLLNATGTHRPNTREELERMLTPAVVRRHRVVNHHAEDASSLVRVGSTRDGTPAWLNRSLIEADVRIITGFIEPHFFAGFSGGPKGIMPGVAGLATIMANHGTAHLNDPCATFGVLDGNPVWEEMREIALRAGPSFLLNVSLNARREITGVFAGDLIQAHRAGADFVKRSAMQRVTELFDVVVTTNSGYPLDLNLYQGVKGMGAAARILKPGGTLILACECREGIPEGTPHHRMLREASGPADVLARLAAATAPRPEQWQPQIQALIQQRARVLVHSLIPDDALRAVHLEPCHAIGAAVKEALRAAGNGARVAVLPQGPLTIPYLA